LEMPSAILLINKRTQERISQRTPGIYFSSLDLPKRIDGHLRITSTIILSFKRTRKEYISRSQDMSFELGRN
ncbi:hypothetical protein BGZ49_010747, partial [Haplosporangium sp. Z 27]